MRHSPLRKRAEVGTKMWKHHRLLKGCERRQMLLLICFSPPRQCKRNGRTKLPPPKRQRARRGQDQSHCQPVASSTTTQARQTGRLCLRFAIQATIGAWPKLAPPPPPQRTLPPQTAVRESAVWSEATGRTRIYVSASAATAQRNNLRPKLCANLALLSAFLVRQSATAG